MSPRNCVLTMLLLVSLPTTVTGQPDPATSIVPASIRIVEGRPGPLDVGSTYSVTVNDPVGAPIPGAMVTLDFSGCPHVRPASTQPFAGITSVTCTPPALSATTNVAGVATFVITGAVLSRLAPGTGAACIVVSAVPPPVVLGSVSPSAFDQDGVNGLTANDLSLWFCDFGSGNPFARSDYDGSGAIGINDLTLWLSQYFAAGDATITMARCDGGARTTPAQPTPPGGLFLRWGECEAAGGAQTRLFACAVNTGVETLRASFVAPAGVDALTGFEAEIKVIGTPGVPLPAWWQVQAGGCRPTSLNVSASLVAPAAECPQPAEGAWISGGQTSYPAPGGATDQAIVRIVGTFAPPGLALTAGQQYSLFNLAVNHQRTVGAGACAGCAAPIAILFDRLKLTQPATAAGGCGSPANAPAALTGDFTLRPDMSGDAWVAYWQGVPPGFVVSDAARPEDVPIQLALRVDNPSQRSSRLALSVPRATACKVVLYDVAGRQRRVLLDRPLGPGTHQLDWDGRDDAGQWVKSGYYVWRAVTDDGVISRAQVCVR